MEQDETKKPDETIASDLAGMFAKVLRRHMDKQGLSNKFVAVEVWGDESRRGHVSRYLNATIKNPNRNTLRNFATKLGIPDSEMKLVWDCRNGSSKQNSAKPAGVEELRTTKEFVEVLVECLESSNSFRTLLNGPYICHPEWHTRTRSRSLHTLDFQRAQIERLCGVSERILDTRYIFTLSDRYFQKVSKYLESNQIDEFVTGCQERIVEIWGENLDRGPDICSANIGNSSIPYILDDCVLLQYRSSDHAPTKGGVIIRNQSLRDYEQYKFDTIFEQRTTGQASEVKKLNDFYNGFKARFENLDSQGMLISS